MKPNSTLQDKLESVLASAKAAWPELDVDGSKFATYLTQFIESDDPALSLEKLQVKDLYLAFACLCGDEQALLYFEEMFVPLVRRNVGKLDLGASAIEEIVQRFRYKLFVQIPGGQPKLSQYNGRSNLAVWLRTVALRQALDFVKARDQRDLTLTDTELAAQIVECDQEILLIRKQYQSEFERVLKEAFQSLDSKERNLLRASVLDKLTVDEIGGLYQVHRATAARWLVNLRLKLKDEIKQKLKHSLNLDTYEYEKIAAVLNSQLNLSLSRILKPPV